MVPQKPNYLAPIMAFPEDQLVNLLVPKVYDRTPQETKFNHQCNMAYLQHQTAKIQVDPLRHLSHTESLLLKFGVNKAQVFRDL